MLGSCGGKNIEYNGKKVRKSNTSFAATNFPTIHTNKK